MITVTCIECGKKFEAQRTSAKFCSANCRVKWNNKNIATETLVLEETKELNGHEEKKTEIEGMAIPKKTFPTNAEKLAKLRETMAKIDKDFGAGSVMILGDAESVPMEAVSTGSLTLNDALGIGGIPKGRITEIYGQESSGKTTITLHIIKEAQKQGLLCVFIDAEHAFDDNYAKAIGVDIDNLLVSQPDYGEQALEIVDRLATSGSVGVIIVDSVAALVPKSELQGEMGDSKMGLHARLMSQACRKLTAVISNTDTILIFINQLRMKIGAMPHESPYVTTGGKALKFYASVRMEVSRIGQLKDGDEALGNKTKVKVVKNKCAAPYKVAEFDIIYGKGIDTVGEIIDLAVQQNIINKSGSWYSYNGNKLGQGKDNISQILNDHPDMLAEIQAKVK